MGFLGVNVFSLLLLLVAISLASVTECKKLQVLALHGYMHNGADFCRCLDSWDKAFKDLVNFTCLNGPFKAGPDHHSWADDTESPDLESDKAVGIASVLDHIRNTGPYDGVFGHSQGGAVAGILGGIIEKRIEVLGRRVSDESPPRFVIVHEGRLWDGLPQKVFTTPLRMKSLFIFGYNDFRGVVSQLLLASKYENPVRVWVDMPHARPCAKYMDENLSRQLMKFFRSAMTSQETEGEYTGLASG